MHFSPSFVLFGSLCCFLVASHSFVEAEESSKSERIISVKPPYAESCRIYEPGFTKCSTRSIQKLMDAIVEGVPEIEEELGPIDPMILDNIIFKQDNNEAATIRANITNLSVKGFSKIKIKESRVSKKDFSWQTKVFVPRLRMDGQYKMDGKVLLLPLTGNGNIYLEIENLDILCHTKTRLYEKAGFTFYNVTEVRTRFDMTGAKANLDNLFNGRNKEIEKTTNEFFNENWRDFFEALRPIITDTVERVMQRILKSIFDKLPANFIVEDIPTSTQLYGPKGE